VSCCAVRQSCIFGSGSHIRPDNYRAFWTQADIPDETIHDLARINQGTPAGDTNEIQKMIFDSIDYLWRTVFVFHAVAELYQFPGDTHILPTSIVRSVL
jgi:hypothetical protein